MIRFALNDASSDGGLAIQYEVECTELEQEASGPSLLKVNMICLTNLALGPYWVLQHAAIIVFYFIKGGGEEDLKETADGGHSRQGSRVKKNNIKVFLTL